MEHEIPIEQFVPDHLFLHIIKGTIRCYDGNKTQTIKSGDYCLFRKNSLVRYSKDKGSTEFDIITICLEEKFLRIFQTKYKIVTIKSSSKDAFIKIKEDKLISDFISSLKPYYTRGVIDDAFADIKYEELLLILLQKEPAFSELFFDYGIPGKIDLEVFMNHNYKFNVSMERFAFLTGRSISSFKRDFQQLFNDTPNRWLIKKRLEEAYFLIDKKNKKPTDILTDLGFEDLSHFSFAFKKMFGHTPTDLIQRRKYIN